MPTKARNAYDVNVGGQRLKGECAVKSSYFR
jgi:hypothetical protein